MGVPLAGEGPAVPWRVLSWQSPPLKGALHRLVIESSTNVCGGGAVQAVCGSVGALRGGEGAGSCAKGETFPLGFFSRPPVPKDKLCVQVGQPH